MQDAGNASSALADANFPRALCVEHREQDDCADECRQYGQTDGRITGVRCAGRGRDEEWGSGHRTMVLQDIVRPRWPPTPNPPGGLPHGETRGADGAGVTTVDPVGAPSD